MPKPMPTPKTPTRQCRGCLKQQPVTTLNHLMVCQECRDAILTNPRSVAIRAALRRRLGVQI